MYEAALTIMNVQHIVIIIIAIYFDNDIIRVCMVHIYWYSELTMEMEILFTNSWTALVS